MDGWLVNNFRIPFQRFSTLSLLRLARSVRRVCTTLVELLRQFLVLGAHHLSGIRLIYLRKVTENLFRRPFDMLQQGSLHSRLQRSAMRKHALGLVMCDAQIVVFAWELRVHISAVPRLDALSGQEEFAQFQLARCPELVRSLARRIRALAAIVEEADAIVRVIWILGAGGSLAPATASATMFASFLERGAQIALVIVLAVVRGVDAGMLVEGGRRIEEHAWRTGTANAQHFEFVHFGGLQLFDLCAGFGFLQAKKEYLLKIKTIKPPSPNIPSRFVLDVCVSIDFDAFALISSFH